MDVRDCPAEPAPQADASQTEIRMRRRPFNRPLTVLWQTAGMSASPLTFVPVFLGLALHIAGFVAPLSPQSQCFAGATVDDRVAWRAAQVVRADPDRGEARRGEALYRVEARQAQAMPCRAEPRLTPCGSGARLAATEAARALP